MAHRRTGGRGGKYSEVADKFASLVLGGSRKPPEYRVFSRTASKKFLRLYTGYEQGDKQKNKEQRVNWQGLSISELLQKCNHACLSRTFFDGSYIEEKLREALGRHAHAGRKMRSIPLLQRPA